MASARNMCAWGFRRGRALFSVSGRLSHSQLSRSPHRTLFSKTESNKETNIKGESESGVDPLPTEEKDKALQKLEELQSQINIVNDKYKRALAETENVRLRMTRQVHDAKLFGIQDFCKELLEVADILGKATESVPSSELSDANPHLKNLFEGLKMTEAQLHTVFRRHGLTQINPVGEKFDPNKHEALFEQAVQGKDPGTVAVVTKVGYSLHDRTIRPALVGVVKM